MARPEQKPTLPAYYSQQSVKESIVAKTEEELELAKKKKKEEKEKVVVVAVAATSAAPNERSTKLTANEINRTKQT